MCILQLKNAAAPKTHALAGRQGTLITVAVVGVVWCRTGFYRPKNRGEGGTSSSSCQSTTLASATIG